MGRKREMKRPEPTSQARKVATIKGLKREPDRIYFIQGNAVYSIPRRGYSGATQKEMDIPALTRREGYIYYLKGSDVMEAPMRWR